MLQLIGTFSILNQLVSNDFSLRWLDICTQRHVL
jgi:hypothetical protein